MSSLNSTRPTRILAAIVLYRQSPAQSVAFQTLQAAIASVDASEVECTVFLHDNSPSASHAVPPLTIYEAAERNSGLASAYNRALGIASNEHYEWLLTLDQDTALPVEFLKDMSRHVKSMAEDETVGAVVPQLYGNGKRISPNRFVGGVWPAYYPEGFVGLTDGNTFAFNSGAILRVSALKAAGGYDPRFWLDYCDASMFCRLHHTNKQIFLAGDVRVEHNFSMQDFKQNVSVLRYANVVQAGSAFWDLEMSWLAGLDHTARLAFRVLKHLYRGDDRQYLELTLSQLHKRLFWSKQRRLAHWGRSLAQLESQQESASTAPAARQSSISKRIVQ